MAGVETLHPDFRQLWEEGTEPEHLMFYKLLSMSGPVPSQLVPHLASDEFWHAYARQLVKVVAEDVNDRFMAWYERNFPTLDFEINCLIMSMTNLDPAKRAVIHWVMKDPFWRRAK